MKITLPNDAKNILNEMKKMGETYIFGGYIRDRYFGHDSNDIDMVTKASIDDVEKKFGHLEKAKKRIAVNGETVFGFKYEGDEKNFFEIVFTKDDPFEKSHKADYTINSLMTDGEKIFDFHNGIEDLKNKKIKAVDENIIKEDFVKKPILILKTLRLSSSYNMSIENNVLELMKKNMNLTKEIEVDIIQNEGHKTLNNKNFERAFIYLEKMSLMKLNFEKKDKTINIEEYLRLNKEQKLVLLSEIYGEENIKKYIEIFKFKQDLKDKYENLLKKYKFENKIENKNEQQRINGVKKAIINK